MNKINLSAFDPVRAKFNANEYFFTAEQCSEWQKSKPLQGLKILHNFPLYDNTLLKIEALLSSGATVWISAPRNIPPNPKAVSFIQDLGLPYLPAPGPIKEEFDLVLDCSADYASYVTPTLGYVEVTGTGSHFFQNNQYAYPVISVDDSILKRFETTLGTGDGCMRALQEWFSEDLSQHQFIVFGFGKVGSGVALKLRQKVKNVVVVDVAEDKVLAARDRGFTAYMIGDYRLKDVIQHSFAMITATGREHAITKHFADKSWFKNVHLINMGVHDEYGPAFGTEEVVFAKQAINFSLAEPTRTRYIDPIFYAHNLGADLLLSGQFENGYHPFPPELDAAITKRWQAFHGEELER